MNKTDKWVTLNNTTVRIDDILSIETETIFNQIVFHVYLTHSRRMTVNLNATGGKYLFYLINEGSNTAEKELKRNNNEKN
jgi:hypothetical protein